MHKVRILVVDDEEDVRDLVVDLVMGHDHVTIKAANGEEAQGIIQKAKPPVDIVVTDHDMPQMNGSTLITWIKSEHPGIKVILMSGRGARHPLADEHISKPTDVLRKLPSIIETMKMVIVAAREKNKK